MHRLLSTAALATGILAVAPFGAMAQTTPAPATPAAAPAPAADLGFFGRLNKAYVDEMNHYADPNDPNAPVSNRAAPYPPQPQTSPPMPFTVWPYGGTNPVGATIPSSVDSPLMTALGPTGFGTWLNDNHIQIYGWVNPGMNLSTSQQHKGGNFPAAYAYDPNTVWLDQVVVLFERLPDTVQKDHIDWGFRVSPLYGETYRYTTALGFASYQLQRKNNLYGFDVPMIYGELYIPNIAEGLMIRAGRYISVPDTEAQLAPNNYMYSHSMTYGYDNYTNTGVLASLQATRNLVLQLGVTIGTDSALWDAGTLQQNFKATGFVGPSNKDPGVQPSLTACIRYQTDTAYDAAYVCANGINNGTWGYNNLQQYAMTYYHKFNEQWHMTFEAWHMHENNTPNTQGPTANSFYSNNLLALANGPFGAYCKSRAFCTSQEFSLLSYLNYSWDPLNNVSFRVEFFDDMSGRRTGVKDRYFNYAIGWQHWFSPTIMIRPEIAVYNALDTRSFNRTGQGNPGSATAMSELVASMDLIWHF